jgi:hypothetical protein
LTNLRADVEWMIVVRERIAFWFVAFNFFCLGLMVGAWRWGPAGSAPTIGRWLIVGTLLIGGFLRWKEKPTVTSEGEVPSSSMIDRPTFYFLFVVGIIATYLIAYFAGYGDPVAGAQRRSQ